MVHFTIEEQMAIRDGLKARLREQLNQYWSLCDLWPASMLALHGKAMLASLTALEKNPCNDGCGIADSEWPDDLGFEMQDGYLVAQKAVA